MKPQAALFKQHARPVLWTNLEALKESFGKDWDDEIGYATEFSFGYQVGDFICLIPLQDEDERVGYWRSPVCTSEDDAKRIWFIVQKLLDALDGNL